MRGHEAVGLLERRVAARLRTQAVAAVALEVVRVDGYVQKSQGD